MDIDVSEKSLPVFTALDSKVRIAIINLLSKSKMNVAQLSRALGLSSTIIIMHLNSPHYSDGKEGKPANFKPAD